MVNRGSTLAWVNAGMPTRRARARQLRVLLTLVLSVCSLLAVPPAGIAGARAEPFVNAALAEGAEGRVYVANEVSGTVSIIKTASHAVAATICLGSDAVDDLPGTPSAAFTAAPCNAELDHHRPFYDGHAGTHGLWLSDDGGTLLATNRLSSTVVALDANVALPCAATGCAEAVLAYTPVGREPHLATVRPGSGEAWVAIRGERQIDILALNHDRLRDTRLPPTERMPRTDTVQVGLGPSMITFTADGRLAFVAYGKDTLVDKLDARTRQVVASRPLPAALRFTPFGLVTPDDLELYLVHKGAGSLSILRTEDLSAVVQGLPLGPRPNHIFFVGNFAYITVGGPAPSDGNADPEGKVVVVDRTSHAIVRELTGSAWAGEPHGIWAAPEGGRLYIGHERGNRVTVLDTGDPNIAADDQIVGTITDPLMKQPIDIVSAAPTFGSPPNPPGGATRGGDLIEICHREGNGGWHEITVDSNAVAAHVAHGDVRPTAGRCPTAEPAGDRERNGLPGDEERGVGVDADGAAVSDSDKNRGDAAVSDSDKNRGGAEDSE